MNRRIPNSKFSTLKRSDCFSPWLFVFIFFFSILSGCGDISRVRYGQETVKVAVLPAYSLSLMNERYQPLLRYLSNETGYDVQYLSSNSYNSYGATVQGSRAQLVFCDPLVYLTLRRTAGAEALAIGLGRDGSPECQGLIIVRNDSGINSLDQLAGRKVGIASQLSAEGFLSQAITLTEAGMDARRHLKIIPCRYMDEVIKKLRQGDIDAGFIGPGAWRDSLAKEFTILSRTHPVPNWVCASLPHIDPEVRNKISSALLSMNLNKEDQARVLNGLGLSGFLKPEEDLLAAVRLSAEKANLPF